MDEENFEEIWMYCENCDQWFPPDENINRCTECGNDLVEMSMLE